MAEADCPKMSVENGTKYRQDKIGYPTEVQSRACVHGSMNSIFKRAEDPPPLLAVKSNRLGNID